MVPRQWFWGEGGCTVGTAVQWLNSLLVVPAFHMGVLIWVLLLCFWSSSLLLCTGQAKGIGANTQAAATPMRRPGWNSWFPVCLVINICKSMKATRGHYANKWINQTQEEKYSMWPHLNLEPTNVECAETKNGSYLGQGEGNNREM